MITSLMLCGSYRRLRERYWSRFVSDIKRATASSWRTEQGCSQHYTAFAISRSLNFWIFPVEVFGNSVNTTWRGHL